MALYKAKAPDGSEIQFEATSLTNAKAIYKERYGKTPLSIGKVIGGGTPTTIPKPPPVPQAPVTAGTTPETWAADYEKRYGTAPTATPGNIMWEYIQNKIAQGIPLTNIEQAYLKSNLSSVGGEAGRTTGGWTDEQTGEFEAYMVDVNSGRYPNLPSFGNIEEFWEFRNNLSADQDYYFSTTAGSLEQWDIWEHYQAFGSTYGDLDDYSATNWADFINNYDQALQQYEAWRTEAGSEAAGFTDDQIREKAAYMQYYYQYGKPGDLVPVDVGDFINRRDEFLQQQAIWQQQAREVEKYEVDPAEAARRREEGYAESRYAAQERYRETPEYFDPFTQMMNQQSRMSGAFRGFVEDEYASLRSGYQATQPRLTGFPTREAARTEAERREAGFKAWIPQQIPEKYQEFMSQRPWERDVRYATQSPTLRATNW